MCGRLDEMYGDGASAISHQLKKLRASPYREGRKVGKHVCVFLEDHHVLQLII